MSFELEKLKTYEHSRASELLA